MLTITGLIILGIVLDLGGGPNHDRIGFRYWKDPGPFAQFQDIPGNEGRFLGWWAVMTQAAFSFIGTEVVAIAAGEAKNPRMYYSEFHFTEYLFLPQVVTFPRPLSGSISVSWFSILGAH